MKQQQTKQQKTTTTTAIASSVEYLEDTTQAALLHAVYKQRTNQIF